MSTPARQEINAPEAGDGLLQVQLQRLGVSRHERQEQRARHNYHARPLLEGDAADGPVGIVHHVHVANGLSLVERVCQQRRALRVVVRALLLRGGGAEWVGPRVKKGRDDECGGSVEPCL